MAQKNYNLSICYIKAFAIMLMVLGHACSDNIPGMPLLMPFIVMFHMPIFFIASGYCFKEKYLSSLGKYLYNKVKGIWWPYVKWGLLFLLLHNVFFNLHLYNDKYGHNGATSCIYTLSDISSHAINIVTKMTGTEQLLCANWFLNALFWGTLIAWVIIKYVPNLFLGGGALLIICVMFNFFHWHIPYFLISSQAFAAALLITIGFAMSKYKIKPFNNTMIALSLLLTFVGSLIWKMALNMDYYSNFRFLPYIFTAVLATWSFYSLFEKLRSSKSVFTIALTFIGRNTLTVLIWHLTTFKLVSLLIIQLYGLPIERLAEFPVMVEYANKGWWIVYFFVAMFTTCGIAYCNKWIKNSWLKL